MIINYKPKLWIILLNNGSEIFCEKICLRIQDKLSKSNNSGMSNENCV